MRATQIKLPICKCPSCGGRLDAATAAISPQDGESRGPSDGDITFCIYCAEVLIFNADLTTRKAEKKDLSHLDVGDIQQLISMQNVVRSLAAKRLKRQEGTNAH